MGRGFVPPHFQEKENDKAKATTISTPQQSESDKASPPVPLTPSPTYKMKYSNKRHFKALKLFR